MRQFHQIEKSLNLTGPEPIMGDVDTRLDEASKVRRRYQNIAAFICLCLVMGISPGLVMCVGCDGDVALRSGLHAHDQHGAPATTCPLAHQSTDDHEEDHDHCGRCVDVPLSMYAVDQGVPDDHTDLWAFVALAEAGATDAQADSLARHPVRAFSQTPYFTSLRSIVLLV
jgi:hypothetical protein